MHVRVTQGMLSSQVLSDIEGNYQRLSQLQNESATGKKINSPSDDPIGVQFVMQDNNQLAYDTQYQQNATNAQSQLSYTSSAMTEAQNVLSRARDLAVKGASSTETKSDMQATAAEVGQLYNQMVTIGNSQYNGQYIFNGQNTAQPPYPTQAENLTPDKMKGTLDPAAVTTQNGQNLFSVGSGVTIPVGVSGNDFFGSASSQTNAFGLLGQLYTALNAGDSSKVGGLISQFDSSLNQMNQSQANVGALTDRAQLMQNRMSDLSQNVTKQLSNTQDADMAAVLTQLNSAMAVQQASVQVGAQALPETLLNFLK